MTELARIDDTTPVSTLNDQMSYAKAVSTAQLLPQAYRGKPADIMLAVGLGQSMGLSPAESLYRIDVIQGKPTASAELIAANVRKAGHVLRLRVDEQAVSATCTIIRADDPTYEHTVTRDKAWAAQMGLAAKDNYKKQPATMLGWRAVTACARMACPEALYGVAYTSDEMVDTAPTTGRLAAALHVEQVQPEMLSDAGSAGATPAQLKKLATMMTNAGITDRAAALAYVNDTIGRDVESRNDLTRDEAGAVIDALEADERPAGDA